MNYTEVKRYLVYKDKLDIDEFNISDPKSMDGVLFNFLEHSWIAGLADAPKLICSIFDTAHYIVTLIHLEAHPLLHIASYLDKADHVGADGPHFVHTHHLELRAATMGLVCNYLRVLSPEHLDVKAFLRAVHDQIEGSEPSTGARLSVHMVGAFKEPYDIFYEITHLPDIQSRTLLREDFRPRPIIEALQESNYEDIAENMAFIKLRIGQLSDEEQQLAKKIIQRVTKDTGEKALEGAMPEAAADVRKMMARVAQEFGFELTVSKQQEENVDDSKGSQAIIKEQKKVIEDLKREYQKKLKECEEHKIEPANAFEKIIFFCTVLSAAYDSTQTNQTGLSELICLICGGQPSTFQPRISKLADMSESGSYDKEVINAAKKLVKKLISVPRGENAKIQTFIDSIIAEFSIKDV
jgi:predicted hydrocarbon binding protein